MVGAPWALVAFLLSFPLALAQVGLTEATPGTATLSFDFDGLVLNEPTIPDSIILLFVHLGNIDPPRETSFSLYWTSTDPGKVDIAPFGGPLSYGVGWVQAEAGLATDTLTNTLRGRVRGLQRAVDGEVHFYVPLSFANFDAGAAIRMWVSALSVTDSSGVTQNFTAANTVTLGPEALAPEPFALTSVVPGFAFNDRTALPVVLRGYGLDQVASAMLVSGIETRPLLITSSSGDGTGLETQATLTGLSPGSYYVRLVKTDVTTFEGLRVDILAAPQVPPSVTSTNLLPSPDSVAFLDLSWAPDSQYLAAFGLQSSPGVFLLDLQTGTFSRISTRFAIKGAWSPDGGTLAFEAREWSRNAQGFADFRYGVYAFDRSSGSETLIAESQNLSVTRLVGWTVDSLITVSSSTQPGAITTL